MISLFFHFGFTFFPVSALAAFKCTAKLSFDLLYTLQVPIAYKAVSFISLTQSLSTGKLTGGKKFNHQICQMHKLTKKEILIFVLNYGFYIIC